MAKKTPEAPAQRRCTADGCRVELNADHPTGRCSAHTDHTPPAPEPCYDCRGNKPKAATMLCMTCLPAPRYLCSNCSRAHPGATVRPDA